jgi:biopolymer transport protein ExbB
MTSFGLSHIWTQGDVVIRLILLILLTMSVLSWGTLCLKAWDLWQHRRSAQAAAGFWEGPNWEAGLHTLKQSRTILFWSLASKALDAIQEHRTTSGPTDAGLGLNHWVSRSLRQGLDEQTQQLKSGLALLASIGSTAPFVGLLGTVWGIYHALVAMGQTGQASLDAVAGPIGETLIMTALGLAVAIPAVLSYNALIRGNAWLVAQLNRFAHRLVTDLLTSQHFAPTPKERSNGI